jgi:hypothetical protein
MIKGLLNVMGVKPGQTVLDPMMGSGTVLIEATLMGIHSIGVDASPFCSLMTHAKLDGLTLPLRTIRAGLKMSVAVFQHFSALVPHAAQQGRHRRAAAIADLLTPRGAEARPIRGRFPVESVDDRSYNFLLLAFLDGAGYSERSQRKSPYDQFRAILERYLFVAEKIQTVLAGSESELGHSQIILGDARRLQLDDSSVEGILFSPPYTFAIDYLANDAFHLNFLRVDQESLRECMVGLHGNTPIERFERYKADMAAIISECARVLQAGGICTIVVGTNSNQLSKILSIPVGEVVGMDELMVQIGAQYGLILLRKISRQITGMANTMRTEFIVMLRKQ